MKKKRISFPETIKKLSLAAALCIVCSYSVKAQGSSAPSSSPDMAQAFSAAGASLLKEPVSIRDFSLPLLGTAGTAAGGTDAIQTLSALKGKVVFLNFWATWCGPCRAEMPSMEALYGKYREKGLEILAVNCAETQADVAAFMEENNFSFPVILDNEGTAGQAYGIRAIPTTFLVNQEGKIIMRLVGTTNWDTPEFHAALDLLLESGQPPQI